MKICTITNGISQDYETCCQVMNETGIQYAELQEVYGKRIEFATLDQARQIRDLNEKYGIKAGVVTTHAFVGIPVNSLEVGDDKYNEQMALLKNGFEIAKIVGADYVRTMCFSRQVVQFGENGADQWVSGGNKAWPKFIELFRPIVRAAKEAGIKLIVENGFNGMLTSAWTYEKMLEDLGEDSDVGFLWDPTNALNVHEIPYPNAYECCKKHLAHGHIKDALVDTVQSSVRCVPIGRGTLAPYLLDMAAALRADGYDGYVSLENIYRPDGGDFVDGYRIDIETLKEIFG